jgi:hypothetical protein
MTPLAAEELFAKHLNLAPLHGRRRGLVRCIFHQEKTPSLSVDLNKLVFNCHGCGKNGGWRKFAQLVHEPARIAAPVMPRRAHAPAPHVVVGRDIDALRAAYVAVGAARRLGTRLGDGDPTWELLDEAAGLETAAENAELDLDQQLTALRWRQHPEFEQAAAAVMAATR